jgi:hypothetical protein
MASRMLVLKMRYERLKTAWAAGRREEETEVTGEDLLSAAVQITRERPVSDAMFDSDWSLILCMKASTHTRDDTAVQAQSQNTSRMHLRSFNIIS